MVSLSPVASRNQIRSAAKPAERPKLQEKHWEKWSCGLITAAEVVKKTDTVALVLVASGEEGGVSDLILNQCNRPQVPSS